MTNFQAKVKKNINRINREFVMIVEKEGSLEQGAEFLIDLLQKYKTALIAEQYEVASRIFANLEEEIIKLAEGFKKLKGLNNSSVKVHELCEDFIASIRKKMVRIHHKSGVKDEIIAKLDEIYKEIENMNLSETQLSQLANLERSSSFLLTHIYRELNTIPPKNSVEQTSQLQDLKNYLSRIIKDINQD